MKKKHTPTAPGRPKKASAPLPLPGETKPLDKAQGVRRTRLIPPDNTESTPAQEPQAARPLTEGHKDLIRLLAERAVREHLEGKSPTDDTSAAPSTGGDSDRTDHGIGKTGRESTGGKA